MRPAVYSKNQVLDLLNRIESDHDLSIRGTRPSEVDLTSSYHGPIRHYTFREPIEELECG